MHSRRTLLKSLILASVVIPAPAQSPESHWVLGFEQRVRNENWNNIMDFSSAANDEREQIRWRTRFWVTTPAKKGISISVGLDQETNQKLGQNPYFDEIFLETLSVNIDRLFAKGLSLRAGRQNMNHGEGFILMDGTSGDGSRSLYFNGFDLSYKAKKSNVELIGIIDPATERYLPTVHSQHRLLQNWDERAIGVYYTDKHLGPATLEGYWFYKQEINDRTAVASAQHQPDRFLHTVGWRASVPLTRDWLAVGEFAAQRGHQVGGKADQRSGRLRICEANLPACLVPVYQSRVCRSLRQQTGPARRHRELGSDIFAMARVERTGGVQPGSGAWCRLLDKHEYGPGRSRNRTVKTRQGSDHLQPNARVPSV